jgi:hypothetical protein
VGRDRLVEIVLGLYSVSAVLATVTSPFAPSIEASSPDAPGAQEGLLR